MWLWQVLLGTTLLFNVGQQHVLPRNVSIKKAQNEKEGFNFYELNPRTKQSTKVKKPLAAGLEAQAAVLTGTDYRVIMVYGKEVSNTDPLVQVPDGKAIQRGIEDTFQELSTIMAKTLGKKLGMVTKYCDKKAAPMSCEDAEGDHELEPLEKFDFEISSMDGAYPYVAGPGGCGVPNAYIHLPYSLFLYGEAGFGIDAFGKDENKGRIFLSLWMNYRYGLPQDYGNIQHPWSPEFINTYLYDSAQNKFSDYPTVVPDMCLPNKDLTELDNSTLQGSCAEKIPAYDGLLKLTDCTLSWKDTLVENNNVKEAPKLVTPPFWNLQVNVEKLTYHWGLCDAKTHRHEFPTPLSMLCPLEGQIEVLKRHPDLTMVSESIEVDQVLFPVRLLNKGYVLPDVYMSKVKDGPLTESGGYLLALTVRARFNPGMVLINAKVQLQKPLYLDLLDDGNEPDTYKHDGYYTALIPPSSVKSRMSLLVKIRTDLMEVSLYPEQLLRPGLIPIQTWLPKAKKTKTFGGTSASSHDIDNWSFNEETCIEELRQFPNLKNQRVNYDQDRDHIVNVRSPWGGCIFFSMNSYKLCEFEGEECHTIPDLPSDQTYNYDLSKQKWCKDRVPTSSMLRFDTVEDVEAFGKIYQELIDFHLLEFFLRGWDFNWKIWLGAQRIHHCDKCQKHGLECLQGCDASDPCIRDPQPLTSYKWVVPGRSFAFEDGKTPYGDGEPNHKCLLNIGDTIGIDTDKTPKNYLVLNNVYTPAHLLFITHQKNRYVFRSTWWDYFGGVMACTTRASPAASNQVFFPDPSSNPRFSKALNPKSNCAKLLRARSLPLNNTDSEDNEVIVVCDSIASKFIRKISVVAIEPTGLSKRQSYPLPVKNLEIYNTKLDGRSSQFTWNVKFLSKMSKVYICCEDGITKLRTKIKKILLGAACTVIEVVKKGEKIWNKTTSAKLAEMNVIACVAFNENKRKRHRGRPSNVVILQKALRECKEILPNQWIVVDERGPIRVSETVTIRCKEMWHVIVGIKNSLTTAILKCDLKGSDAKYFSTDGNPVDNPGELQCERVDVFSSCTDNPDKCQVIKHTECKDGQCKPEEGWVPLTDNSGVVKDDCGKPPVLQNYDKKSKPPKKEGNGSVGTNATFSCKEEHHIAGDSDNKTGITTVCKRTEAGKLVWEPKVLGVCISNKVKGDGSCEKESDECGPHSKCLDKKCWCNPGYEMSSITNICERSGSCKIKSFPPNGQPTAIKVEVGHSVQLKCHPGAVVKDENGVWKDRVVAKCLGPTEVLPRLHLSYPVDLKGCTKMDLGSKCKKEDGAGDPCAVADLSMLCKSGKCECRDAMKKVEKAGHSPPPNCEFELNCTVEIPYDDNTVKKTQDDKKWATLECKNKETDHIKSQASTTIEAACMYKKWFMKGKKLPGGQITCERVKKDTPCVPLNDSTCEKGKNLRCNPLTHLCEEKGKRNKRETTAGSGVLKGRDAYTNSLGGGVMGEGTPTSTLGGKGVMKTGALTDSLGETEVMGEGAPTNILGGKGIMKTGTLGEKEIMGEGASTNTLGGKEVMKTGALTDALGETEVMGEGALTNILGGKGVMKTGALTDSLGETEIMGESAPTIILGGKVVMKTGALKDALGETEIMGEGAPTNILGGKGFMKTGAVTDALGETEIMGEGAPTNILSGKGLRGRSGWEVYHGTQCQKPPLINMTDGAILEGDEKDSYNVGDYLIYKCKDLEQLFSGSGSYSLSVECKEYEAIEGYVFWEGDEDVENAGACIDSPKELDDYSCQNYKDSSGILAGDAACQQTVPHSVCDPFTQTCDCAEGFIKKDETCWNYDKCPKVDTSLGAEMQVVDEDGNAIGEDDPSVDGYPRNTAVQVVCKDKTHTFGETQIRKISGTCLGGGEWSWSFTSEHDNTGILPRCTFTSFCEDNSHCNPETSICNTASKRCECKNDDFVEVGKGSHKPCVRAFCQVSNRLKFSCGSGRINEREVRVGHYLNCKCRSPSTTPTGMSIQEFLCSVDQVSLDHYWEDEDGDHRDEFEPCHIGNVSRFAMCERVYRQMVGYPVDEKGYPHDYAPFAAAMLGFAIGMTFNGVVLWATFIWLLLRLGLI